MERFPLLHNSGEKNRVGEITLYSEEQFWEIEGRFKI